jgi:hypothetical protein
MRVKKETNLTNLANCLLETVCSSRKNDLKVNEVQEGAEGERKSTD